MCIRALAAYIPVVEARLDEIAGVSSSGFAAHGLSIGIQVITCEQFPTRLAAFLNLSAE